MDILSEFIGMDLKALQQESEEVKAKRIEIATAIVKLVEYPEWQVFMSEIDRLHKNIDRPSEVYANNPNLAWQHTGQKESIRIIKDFVTRQSQILQEYAESKSQ